LDSGDSDALRDAAHKLKGKLLVRRCSAHGGAVRQPRVVCPPNAHELMTDLEREFDRVREHLAQLIPLKSA